MKTALAIDNVAAPAIPGLRYIPHYISSEEHSALIMHINNEPWRADLKRRVQHYGYRYDYKARDVSSESFLGPMPSWLLPLCQKLEADHIFAAAPDQVIVNEYEPRQGISAHIDCVPCFKDTIASLSLGSPCVMELTQPTTGEKQSILLEESSLLVLSGEARNHWQHAIPARKSDIVDGIKTLRGRRISLTFRNVIIR